MPDKRLFIAIPLSTDFIEALDEYCKGLSGFDEWRFIPKENWHITVLFLGHVKDEELPTIVETLKKVFPGVKSFTLEFDKIMFAPPGRPPRMIWAQFKKSAEFQRLSNDLNKAFEKFIKKTSMQREALPHATLARLKNIIAAKKELQNFEPKEKIFTISQIYLMESRLSKSGAEYSIIEPFYL